MPLDHMQLKRTAEKGAKKVHGHASSNKVSWHVQMLPEQLFLQWSFSKVNGSTMIGQKEGTKHSMSPQGWIDQELFALWLQKLFVKSIPPARPVVDHPFQFYSAKHLLRQTCIINCITI